MGGATTQCEWGRSLGDLTDAAQAALTDAHTERSQQRGAPGSFRLFANVILGDRGDVFGDGLCQGRTTKEGGVSVGVGAK